MKEYLAAGGVLVHSAKTRAVFSNLEHALILDPTKKIIIFSQFLGTIAIMAELCQFHGWGSKSYTGKMAAKARFKASNQWGQDASISILLASLKCGGEGLNLTAGQDVLMAEPWWNSAAQEQAFGRVFRIGQTKTTTFKLFVVTNSIEFRMLRIQQEKDKEIDPLMAGSKTKGSTFTEQVAQSFDINLDGLDLSGRNPSHGMFGRRGRGKRQHSRSAGAFATSSDEEDAEINDDAFADDDEDRYEALPDADIAAISTTQATNHINVDDTEGDLAIKLKQDRDILEPSDDSLFVSEEEQKTQKSTEREIIDLGDGAFVKDEPYEIIDVGDGPVIKEEFPEVIFVKQSSEPIVIESDEEDEPVIIDAPTVSPLSTTKKSDVFKLAAVEDVDTSDSEWTKITKNPTAVLEVDSE